MCQKFEKKWLHIEFNDELIGGSYNWADLCNWVPLKLLAAAFCTYCILYKIQCWVIYSKQLAPSYFTNRGSVITLLFGAYSLLFHLNNSLALSPLCPLWISARNPHTLAEMSMETITERHLYRTHCKEGFLCTSSPPYELSIWRITIPRSSKSLKNTNPTPILAREMLKEIRRGLTSLKSLVI